MYQSPVNQKDEIREKIWGTLEKEGVILFPGVCGRIPNFKGAEMAAPKELSGNISPGTKTPKNTSLFWTGLLLQIIQWEFIMPGVGPIKIFGRGIKICKVTNKDFKTDLIVKDYG